MPTKKKIGSVHTAKNGRRYKITSKGARFIKGKSKTSKGGSVSVGGGLKRRRRRTKRGGGIGRKLLGSSGYGKAVLLMGDRAHGLYKDAKAGNWW